MPSSATVAAGSSGSTRSTPLTCHTARCRWPVKVRERIGGRKRLEIAAIEHRALGQIRNVGENSRIARREQPRGAGTRQMLHEPQSQRSAGLPSSRRSSVQSQR
jgi:hypothetical protein